jgi:formate dehydrogenase subunit gamma
VTPQDLEGPAREAVEQAVRAHRDTPGPLLIVLHAVQEALGYIPPAGVPLIAEGLNLSRAEVHGVISFYHYFRSTPPGRHTLYLCRAEACQSMHQRALETHVKARLGVDFHETSADGAFTLEPVYCLGNCALSPAMTVDGEIYGRVTPQRFDAVVNDFRLKLEATRGDTEATRGAP